MFKLTNRTSTFQPHSKDLPPFNLEVSKVMKRARIVVDCCGEIRRIIWPLKVGLPCQSEGTIKQYTEEVLILTRVGLVFFTTSMKYEFQEF